MKVVKTISTVIIVLLITALIAGLVLFINNGQSNFYVEYGGQRISNDISNIELKKGGYSVLYVKNVFGDVVNGMPKADYKTTVSLYKKNIEDIEFTADGDVYGLYDIEDFSPAFKITQMNGVLTIYIPLNYTLLDVLKACYPDKEIVIDNDVALWANDCFVLNIKSLAEKKTVTVAFH